MQKSRLSRFVPTQSVDPDSVGFSPTQSGSPDSVGSPDSFGPSTYMMAQEAIIINLRGYDESNENFYDSNWPQQPFLLGFDNKQKFFQIFAKRVCLGHPNMD